MTPEQLFVQANHVHPQKSIDICFDCNIVARASLLHLVSIV
jgi:hypothetical protein